jgi:uncharacterized membrane protein YphA (DoxX/SURF4 family)
MQADRSQSKEKARLDMNTSSRSWQSWLLLVLTVLVAFAFLAAGSTKLLSLPFQIENFERWGYPQWFRYVTGAVEVGAAVLLLLPRTRFWGALVLCATMLGAIFTHIQAHEAPRAIPACVFLTLCTLFAWRARPVADETGRSAGVRA